MTEKRGVVAVEEGPGPGHYDPDMWVPLVL